MISIILNVYKRPEHLAEQLKRILNQSVPVKPENIHIWYNCHDAPQIPSDMEGITNYVCNKNTKFWGRFLIPLICKTEYVALFDDDIFPEKDWFRNCLDTLRNKDTDGILGGSGIILPEKGYTRQHIKVGWNGVHSPDTVEVDLVGHAWFFRQEIAKFLWYEHPATWDNGEDIMLSFLAKKYGGIKTFVPPHPETDKSKWSASYAESMQVGNGPAASFKKKNHILQRDECVEECKSRGWPILIQKDPDIFQKDFQRTTPEVGEMPSNKRPLISANMATFPDRISFLKRAVDSILPNVDVLRVYLNNYTFIPEFLVHPKIQVVFGKEDLKAAGKLFFVPDKRTNEFYFSCDDDFTYTPEFFSRTIEYLDKNPDVFVGTHGVLINCKPGRTYSENYVKKVSAVITEKRDWEVNVLGTGLMCFNCNRHVLPVNDGILPYNFFIDSCIARYLISIGVRLVVRAHTEDEIHSLFVEHPAGYKLCSDRNILAIQRDFFNQNGVVFNKRFEEIKGQLEEKEASYENTGT